MAHRDQTQGLNTAELQTLLLTGHAMSQEQDQERICLWATDAASSMLGSSLSAVAVKASDRDDHYAVYGKLRDSLLAERLTSSLSRLVQIEWPAPQAPGQAATLPKKRLPGALTREGIDHMVRIPVRTIHREFGVLLLGMGGQWEPSDRGQFILSTLANQAAIALENVRLRREADEQAQTLRGLIQASPLAIVARDRQARVQMWNPAAEQIFGWSEEEVLGRPYPLVPEEKEHEFRANIARALQGEPLTGLETRRQKKDGTQIDVSIWTAPFGDGGAMVVVADVSERKQAEKALADMASFAEMNPAPVLRLDRHGTILLVNPAARELLGQPDLLGKSWYALCPELEPIALESALQSNDTLQCETMVGERCLLFTYRASLERSQVHVYGADITERKRAEEALRELVVLEERNRIAREIHDSIAQGLTGIIWQLNAMERTAASAGGIASDALDRVRSLARDSLRDARRSVWDLHAGFPQGQSLGATLREEIDRVTGDGRIRASVEVLGSERVLPSGVETALLRICQESLANMLKYANASEVVTTLEYTDTDVRLALKDNGVGFDPDLPVRVDGDKGGFGLISMRERARLLGGELRVESSPGRGTLVEATLPVR